MNRTSATTRRAAVAVVALGPDRAAPLLRSFGTEELRVLADAIAELGPVEPNEVRDAFAEIRQTIAPRGTLPPPGLDFVRDLAGRVLDPADADRLVDDIAKPKPFAWLASADPEMLASALAVEPPGAIALAFAHLAPDTASHLLGLLPEELRVDVGARIAGLTRVAPQTVVEVEAMLRERLTTVLTRPAHRVEGPLILADVLQRTAPEHRQQVLAGLAETSPELAERTREGMFTFTDVLALPARAMQVLLRAVEVRDLAAALSTMSGGDREKVLSNLSERARENLEEEMSLENDISAAEVLRAQKAVVAVARQLEDEGQIKRGVENG